MGVYKEKESRMSSTAFLADVEVLPEKVSAGFIETSPEYWKPYVSDKVESVAELLHPTTTQETRQSAD
jgi:hypothetical protein